MDGLSQITEISQTDDQKKYIYFNTCLCAANDTANTPHSEPGLKLDQFEHKIACLSHKSMHRKLRALFLVVNNKSN